MRYISFVILLIFFTTTIEASYLRSIRLKSFKTDNEAQKSLIELERFIQTHDNILDLQVELDFEFKVIKLGKFYMLCVEPLTQKDVVQELLDTLRTKYADAYPKKIKSIAIVKKSKKVMPEIIAIEEVKKIESEVKLAIDEEPSIKKEKEQKKEIIDDIVIDNKSVEIEELYEDNLNDQVITEKHISSSNDYIWEILFAITFFVLLIAIRQLYRYKKENELYLDKEMISSEKFKKLHMEMKNKENFLTHASHELRTPMTAIMGLTHIVLEGDLSKVQKDYIFRIENSANNLLNIINDILDFSKIQAGELKIEKVEFNINDILDYVLTIISMQAKNNNINISIDVENDVPSHIVGDSLRLGQVLINLLANSVKFTRDGEVFLGVKKLSIYGSGVTLEFTVSDTGIGMTTSQVENIFQSYSQADESTSREFGGTGLGLSISKQLIEMMDGEIRVQSQKNVGTTFTFTILFKLKDVENKRQYRLPSASFLNKRILIIDSTNKNVISLIRALGYFKYKTHSIPSFEEAILEDEILFDIIIVNQLKLNKNSINKIKKLQAKSGFKIVILSELYSSLNNQILSGLKIDAYLNMPFTQQSVLNMIVELYVSKNLDKRSRKKNSKEKLKEMSGKKILVAEDNIVNHNVILGLLSQTGIEVTFVVNGQEAVDLLKRDIEFNLILMDISMPIMNGFETSKEIRKIQKYNNIPILALTADVMDKSIKKAMQSGMQGHISKPIIIDVFYQKILDALSSKSVEISVENLAKDIKLEHSEEFKELSISIGLSRCDNDKKFYKSILKDFKNMYVNSATTLSKLCSELNFKEARSLSMDIKDVALNIGAYNLCESAAAMEYEFEKGSRSNWVNLISFYTSSLEKLFKDIDKYLDT